MSRLKIDYANLCVEELLALNLAQRSLHNLKQRFRNEKDFYTVGKLETVRLIMKDRI